MRHRTTEADQLIITMEGCVPALSKKLGDLGICNFEELYRFGVQKESDLAQEKKFFSARPGNKNVANSSGNVQINSIRQPNRNPPFDPFREQSNNFQANVVRQSPRRFSNLGKPLSKILEKLVQKNLLQPLTSQRPLPNADPKVYCKYHQTIGHDTDTCIRLRHEIQNLIDAGKISNPETHKPNTQNNPLPNYRNAPPPDAPILTIGTGLTEEQVFNSFVNPDSLPTKQESFSQT